MLNTANITNPESLELQTLPKLEELAQLDYTEREILLARIRAQQLRIKRQNVERAARLPDIADWIEEHCWDAATVIGESDFSKASKVRLEPFQKRILRKVFTIDPHTGQFPYRTFVYSAPKKSGKSGIGAFSGAWYGANVESPNNILILANDREQSSTRVFASARPTLLDLGGKKEGKYVIRLPNGTTVKAVTSNPESEAGDSYGLTIWDELWAYKSERMLLLYDELMPVETRLNSMRMIVTYAGFEDSSDLLLKLYLQIFKDTKETELAEGARVVPELADIQTTNAEGDLMPTCYEVPETGMFYFNDHTRRMSWQQGAAGEKLMKETRTTATETNAYRLIENRWQATESRLLPEGVLEASVKAVTTMPMVLGADAGWKNDTTGLCGVYQGIDGRYKTPYARCWTPRGVDDPLDLWDTIGLEILRLWKAGLILKRKPRDGEKALVLKERLTPIEVYYDPTQLHQVAMTLRKKYRLLMVEFEQNILRLKSDTFLLQQYNDKNIDNSPIPELLSHLGAARSEEQSGRNQGKIRIIHGTGAHAKPIDLAVAQSMAVYQQSLRPRSVGLGVAMGGAKGWQK